MSLLVALMASGSSQKRFVEDVFSALPYTGNGGTQSLSMGIDFATYGGAVMLKARAGTTDHAWYDTARGATADLTPTSTAAQTTQATGVTAFNSTGVAIGALAKINTNAANELAFGFRNADKFFKHTTRSHTNGVADTVDLSGLGAVGMALAKRTDSTGDWLVWHRSQTNGKLTYLNQLAGETTDANLSVSGTILTLAAALATGNYVIYAWAHDASADGLVQCGSYVGGATATTATYASAQSVTVPNGSTVTISGHGGDKITNIVGFSAVEYPAGHQALFGHSAGSSADLSIPCTQTGFPSTVSVSGAELMGLSMTVAHLVDENIAWSNNPSNSTLIHAFSISLAVNSIYAPGNQVIASYAGDFVADGLTFTGIGGGNAGGTLAYYPYPIYSYSNGIQATVTPDSIATQNYPGQQADGTYIPTSNTFTALGTNILIGSMPSGASITITYGVAGSTFINLGWEPGFVLVKKISGASSSGWWVADGARGLFADTTPVAHLLNSTAAEQAYSVAPAVPTGWGVTNTDNDINQSGETYIFMAVRKGPMRRPSTGTQMFNAIARTGTGAAASVTGVGFAPDVVIGKDRGSTGAPNFTDKLRGPALELLSSGTAAAATYANDLTAFGHDGMTLGSGASGQKNTNAATYIEAFLKRYPGVFDAFLYGGTGANQTIAHNLLGVAPELWIVKRRDSAGNWVVGSTLLAATEKLLLNTTATKATDATAWNSAYPTSAALSLGTLTDTNNTGGKFLAMVFATLAGISKVFSYTGNGGSQTINCGFAAGARLVLIKRTDSAGDWYYFDSVRGIASGNDPHVSLNTTAAEVTTDDSIAPAASGFTINQVSATNLNVTSATYIGLALS